MKEERKQAELFAEGRMNWVMLPFEARRRCLAVLGRMLERAAGKEGRREG